MMTLKQIMNSHWGHLLTKPGTALVISFPVWYGLHLIQWMPDLVVWLVPFLLGILPQEYFSIKHKYKEWPHHMRGVRSLGWKDIYADTVAATAGVMWLWPGFGWQWTLGWAVIVVVVLVFGLHKWALP